MDEALRFAERLVAVSTHALGGSVASVILHGSLVLDDYVSGRSDIDLLVIVDRPLDAATTDEFTRALVAEQPEAPARVDARVVTREVAARPPDRRRWNSTSASTAARSPRSCRATLESLT
jgi:predicted nucleotidyltransferase